MKFPLVIVVFGVLFVSVVTSFGFRNCIQRYENLNTFTCINRGELTINSVVSDIPNIAKYLTISENIIKMLPNGSFRHLPQLENLNLSMNYLQTVEPEAFEHLNVLTHINLSHNNISTLSLGVFKGLEKLSQLYLHNNSLVFIHPEAFKPLFSLKSLNLSANQLNNFSSVVHALQPLKQLTNLSLCDNNIGHLAHAYSLPISLSTLFLCQNHLQDLKCHQDLFAKIKYLDLSYNNLTHSCLQNVNLSHINYLNIVSNPNFDILTFLENPTIPPERIDYSGLNLNTSKKLSVMCSYLRGKDISHLNLLQNNIKLLPNNTLENCSSSVMVDLSYNRLKNVSCLRFLKPSNFSSFTIEHNLLKKLTSCNKVPTFPKLKSISFRYNRIWAVESYAFTYAPNLEELKLNINNIIFLGSNAFHGLWNLSTLRLDNNLITDLYMSNFWGLRNLQTLNLRNNRVSVIFEKVFKGLENLIILDLGGNKITQVKNGSFFGMKSLSNLYLDSNQIAKICGDMFHGVETTLQVLDLASNKLRYQSSQKYYSPFSKLHKVYDLKLKSQQPYGLTAIPKGFFKGLDSLKSLSLGNNRLTQLGVNVFDDLRNLKFLSLSEDCNGIQNLSPGIFKNLGNLTVLDLENMCIQSLNSEIFSNLTNLKRLQLTKNGLKHIEVKIFDNLTNLQYLDIWKCPLTCTCNNQDLKRWMMTSKVQVVYLYNMTCSQNHHELFLNFDTQVCDHKERLAFFCSSFFFLCLLMIIPIVYSKSYWRLKYNYFLFISWLNVRWNSSKDLYKYDAFVSYNTRDEDWVYETMLPMLERYHSSKRLRLCLHHRDFQLGRDIIDNIVDSIHNSRKTLCVVSRSYLRSEWCSLEMQLASYKLFDEMRDVLVLIFLEDIPDRELSTYHRMRKVMLKKTYITWPKEPEAQKLFWAKVRTALKGGDLQDDEDDLLTSDDQVPFISN
ncbi:toll-like receptor 13 [Hyla sarda]|uniref:toll-like receptor 13 n=1 Tax=Hyla sarda TaxID=327740 RepID=UPI0024C2B83B|nr:toll-like receptor 13 [Hyla sarda]XP_056398147.1 toll-like receptor 13 [Hyla sarda]XP_056398148.1 toll-like receptor 13 [Hyla sarda]XP_056398149.1 toll-like receptor 13 [Hyla sarda]XP_056398150.1 toll-like receptor 13 [Hyla sarda]XP_056398152.1 toll-like receptor 13 [Hyla sarda]XP_056398153.1 toll-like receptor 13 [Hyla sarda]XP_056398154.1 toll-like receptor 13 [Hyla sarda]XP_056398155.1 toll-like receptor 13 [Hyla sarda]XP_056398156.1 toll-like receptor 13 [Hyla sarda]